MAWMRSRSKSVLNSGWEIPRRGGEEAERSEEESRHTLVAARSIERRTSTEPTRRSADKERDGQTQQRRAQRAFPQVVGEKQNLKDLVWKNFHCAIQQYYGCKKKYLQYLLHFNVDSIAAIRLASVSLLNKKCTKRNY